jgi:hypothetical protein
MSSTNINISINIEAKSGSMLLTLLLVAFNIILHFIRKILQKIYDKRIFDGVEKLLKQRYPKKNNRTWNYQDWLLQRQLNASNRQFPLINKKL